MNLKRLFVGDRNLKVIEERRDNLKDAVFVDAKQHELEARLRELRQELRLDERRTT